MNLAPGIIIITDGGSFGVINLGVTVGAVKRATAGVSGRSRLRPGEIAIAATACTR